MSITIKHLDGPLKGKSQEFDDSARTILVGRSPEADIVYPEECIAVDGEHLKLNRNEDGSYAIELCGSCDVEIDGKAPKDDAPVASGSIVTVGEGGPSFEVLLPGVTIKHLEGPLKGQRQYFPYGTETIVFGRLPRETDVSYPASCKIVGRLHFSLKRNDLGNYRVELTPNHYVEINGLQAENGAVVHSGDAFKLGGDAGPIFGVGIAKPASAGEVTEENKPQTPVRKDLQKTSEDLERAKRVGTYALAGILGCLLFVAGWATFRDFRHEQHLVKLTLELAEADAKVSELAKRDIPQDAQDGLQAAVYLVAKIEGGNEIGQATAWALAPDRLATNAHVTKAIKGNEKEIVLIASNGERIPIKAVDLHPGYSAFKEYKLTLGQMSGDTFKPLDVINEYDVGIIYPDAPLPADPKTGKPVTLELATKDYLKGLKPGAAVASVGFPMEGIAGSKTVTEAPSSLRFGNISALTDVFMCRTEPDQRLLIQHSVPVAGGVSGSPLIDASGKVIGIVSGGNTAALVKGSAAMKPAGAGSDSPADIVRIPNAALVNFAQRVDLLADLLSGSAEQQLASDKVYWKSAAKKFASYFESAANELMALASERYRVAGATKQKIGKGTLTPRNAGAMSFALASHSFVLEPGHIYGFIADAQSGVRIALNVKKEGSSKFLRDAKDPRQTSVPELAPTAWVTVTERTPVQVDVLGMIDQPADYALYVYDWSKSAEASAAEASSAAQP